MNIFKQAIASGVKAEGLGASSAEAIDQQRQEVAMAMTMKHVGHLIFDLEEFCIASMFPKPLAESAHHVVVIKCFQNDLTMSFEVSRKGWRPSSEHEFGGHSDELFVSMAIRALRLNELVEEVRHAA